MARSDDSCAPRASRTDAADAVARPSRRLVLALLTFVLLFGAVGYARLGNRAGLQVEPRVVAASAGAVETPPSPGAVPLEPLAQRLTERVQRQPDDAEAWSMLGRVYGALGRHPQALAAYRRVTELRPDDAQAHSDAADALGAVNGHRLDGEPEALIARALQLDPDNAKALALAGSLALARGDAAGALHQWQRALSQVEPGSARARQLQGVIDGARRRSDAAPARTFSLQPTDPASRGSAGDAAAPRARAAVQVHVALAPALRARAAPEDTVFVYARATHGSAVPLAIQRRRVRDLPLQVTLDDTMAMNPAWRLSGATQVVVGARISKAGDARPQPGDLQGLSSPVAVGTREAWVEIADVVQ